MLSMHRIFGLIGVIGALCPLPQALHAAEAKPVAPVAPAGAASPEAKPAVAEEEFVIEGKVVATYNAEGALTAATVVVKALDDRDREIKVSYHVVLDAIGSQLGRDMNRRPVEVTCTLQNRGSADTPDYWITVKTYQPFNEYAP